MPNGLQPIDTNTGKPGTLIEVEVSGRGLPSLVYDGKRLWFPGKQGLQSIDLVSRQIGPPIVDLYPCMVIVDDSNEFLWMGNLSGAQKLDIQQNRLLSTPVQRNGLCPAYYDPIDRVTPWIYDAGRLWAYDGSRWQMFDTTTGDLKASTPACERQQAEWRVELCIQHAVLGGGKLWVANPDLWTIQSFDAVTGLPDPPIPLLGVPGTLAFDGKRLWNMLFESESGRFQGLQYIVPN